jgi:hypothetical protein
MNTFCQDSQIVGETEAVLFTLMQQGPVDALMQLRNAGTNTINYRAQEFNGTAWVDLGVLGDDTYTTLVASQVRNFKLESDYPQVRFVGNASGGATLEFSVTRYHTRASGGSLPILNL